MKQVILFASISLASGILFTNLYNSLIDTKSWGSNMPDSIGVARNYFRLVNPGNFYRVFSPPNQLLSLVTLILFWKISSPVRFTLATALIFFVLADVLTFAYFYPRNEIMFVKGQLTDDDLLKKTWNEWNRMNWVRTAIVFAGLCFSFVSLHRIYTLK